jgi:small subunit ribosomal protein S20
MANTSSARKAARQIARRTRVNQARRTRMRNYVRDVEEAITAGDAKKAQTALTVAEPEIMHAAQKGVMHKRAASRKVSRLVARVRKLGS